MFSNIPCYVQQNLYYGVLCMIGPYCFHVQHVSQIVLYFKKKNCDIAMCRLMQNHSSYWCSHGMRQLKPYKIPHARLQFSRWRQQCSLQTLLATYVRWDSATKPLTSLALCGTWNEWSFHTAFACERKAVCLRDGRQNYLKIMNVWLLKHQIMKSVFYSAPLFRWQSLHIPRSLMPLVLLQLPLLHCLTKSGSTIQLL